MPNNYTPNPIDTKDIKIPAELRELCEEIACNVHEVWAQQRVDQGWRYGLLRDDIKKQHPNLVPYLFLTEQDKDYDRNTVKETIKMILKLGYIITKEDVSSE